MTTPVLDASYVRGVSLMERGRLGDAVVALQRAAADPTALDAHRRLGECLVRMGRHADAERHLRHVLAHRPDHAEAALILGISLRLRGVHGEALHWLQVRLEADADSWQAWYHAGLAMEALGEIDDAIIAMRQVVRLHPEYADGQLELGALLARRGVRDEPARRYALAAQLAPERPEPWFLLGFRLLRKGMLDPAAEAFDKALALDPNRPEAQAGAATVHLRRRDTAAAIALLEPVVASGVNDPQLVRTWAEICHRAGRSADGVAPLERVLAANRVPRARSPLLHALGDLYDDLGDADASFSAYKAGNDARGLAFDGPHHVAALQHVAQRYTHERLAHMQIGTRASEKPVFIVGMPRSGTSLVEQILTGHSRVAGGGELEAFRDAAIALPKLVGSEAPSYVEIFEHLPTAALDEVADRYLAALDAIDPFAERVTDKMPHNFLHLGLVSQALPGARVILVRRDPVDTLWSCYRQAFGAGLAYTTSLEGLAWFWLGYHELVTHWKQSLHLAIHEVRYEDLVADPETHARSLLAFLGLPWEPACLDVHHNRRYVPTASHAQVQEPIHQRFVQRSAPYREHLEPMLAILREHGVDV